MCTESGSNVRRVSVYGGWLYQVPAQNAAERTQQYSAKLRSYQIQKGREFDEE